MSGASAAEGAPAESEAVRATAATDDEEGDLQSGPSSCPPRAVPAAARPPAIASSSSLWDVTLDETAPSQGDEDGGPAQPKSQRGKRAKVAATEEVLQQAESQLRDALALLPDGKETAGYRQALQRAPHLVELESPARSYLKFDKLDPWAAAKRIVRYWDARLELFGPDRAFLPLTLSGDGALSPDDVKVLRTGNFVVLPDDTRGRPVVLQDRARLMTPDVTDAAKRLRCLFYVLSIVAARPCSWKTGYVFLSVFSNKTRRATFDVAMSWKAIQLFGLNVVLPLRLASAHHVILSSRPALSAVIPWTRGVFAKMGALLHKPESMVIHADLAMDDLHADLRTYGFHLEGLPKVPLQGLHTFGCFRQWLDDRARLEAQLYADCGPTRATLSGRIGTGGSGVEADDPEASALRKRRAKEAAHARRKRARKRIERRVHESEIERLEEQRCALRQTGDRLQCLLNEAQHLVDEHEKERVRYMLQLPQARQMQQPHLSLLPRPLVLPGTVSLRAANAPQDDFLSLLALDPMLMPAPTQAPDPSQRVLSVTRIPESQARILTAGLPLRHADPISTEPTALLGPPLMSWPGLWTSLVPEAAIADEERLQRQCFLSRGIPSASFTGSGLASQIGEPPVAATATSGFLMSQGNPSHPWRFNPPSSPNHDDSQQRAFQKLYDLLSGNGMG